MLKKVAVNPIHAVMGLVQIGIGFFLVSHDTYFRWPPGTISRFANDDVIGFALILLGIGFLWWVLDDESTVTWDHRLLIMSAGCLSMLTIYQLLHALIMGINMPWISNAALTAIIMILAARSDSGEN